MKHSWLLFGSALRLTNLRIWYISIRHSPASPWRLNRIWPEPIRGATRAWRRKGGSLTLARAGILPFYWLACWAVWSLGKRLYGDWTGLALRDWRPQIHGAQ